MSCASLDIEKVTTEYKGKYGSFFVNHNDQTLIFPVSGEVVFEIDTRSWIEKMRDIEDIEIN